MGRPNGFVKCFIVNGRILNFVTNNATTEIALPEHSEVRRYVSKASHSEIMLSVSALLAFQPLML